MTITRRLARTFSRTVPVELRSLALELLVALDFLASVASSNPGSLFGRSRATKSYWLLGVRLLDRRSGEADEHVSGLLHSWHCFSGAP